MTSDQITARNRANARRSTGPKTALGKAIVAGNARQHGATARPERAVVATWLSIILGRSELTPADLLPSDEAGYRALALALAEAEARLVAAEEALIRFEAGQEEPSQRLVDLRNMAELIEDDPIVQGDTTNGPRSRLAQVLLLGKFVAEEAEAAGECYRLLRRYASEARSRRRKAFLAWAEVMSAGKGPISQNKAKMRA